MIITGGTVFLGKDDSWIKFMSITDAKVVLDVSDPPTLKEIKNYIHERTGNNSTFTRCTFMSLQGWARHQAEGIVLRAMKEQENVPFLTKAKNYFRKDRV